MSAGTGNIVWAIAKAHRLDQLRYCHANEINEPLAGKLAAAFPDVEVHAEDFLTCNGNLGTFDRIVMNPPFTQGADIQHILRARAMLNPGGKLVALCANGPRQQEQLKPFAETWEILPEGSFQEAGTNVRVALLTIQG